MQRLILRAVLPNPEQAEPLPRLRGGLWYRS